MRSIRCSSSARRRGDANDPVVAATVAAALAAGTVVIPVVDDLADFARDVPDALRPINGLGWSGPSAGRALARVLLAELGIEDRQRRVFISHKREDGLGAAEQLHDALSHHRFTPFIDRFVIREGEDVQATIADALEDHAFLLLLETPIAHTSDWAFDEVDYALTHTMGTIIVRWPGTTTSVPGSAGLPRLTLTAAAAPRRRIRRQPGDRDVGGQPLTARQLRERRQRAVGDHHEQQPLGPRARCACEEEVHRASPGSATGEPADRCRRRLILDHLRRLKTGPPDGPAGAVRVDLRG